VLVVPDKLRTFDRGRPITPLDHLVADFKNPDSQRDLEHFREWRTLVVPVPPELRESVAAQDQREGHDIHYHVWTYESFRVMIAWTGVNIPRWDAIWSHPGSTAEDANEFYFVLKK